MTQTKWYQPESQECLPGEDKFVAKSKPSSFGEGEIAWEASTLPLSYTRINRI
jgi:hypothetical protein